MAENNLYIYGALLVAFLIHRFFFSRAAIVKRKLSEVNGKKISAVENNEIAKVVGEVKYLGKTLTAPLSGRKCVYYHILVEQLEGRSGTTWMPFLEEEVAADVVIKDGANYAIIETNLVKSHLVPDRKYSSGLFNKADEQLNKYLVKHGRNSRQLGINRTLRYKEGILEEGEMLAVVGKGKWQTKNQVKLKIPAEKILLISSDNQEPVYFTDDPEGIDEAE